MRQRLPVQSSGAQASCRWWSAWRRAVIRDADASSTPVFVRSMEKVPSGQSNLSTRLLEATAHPCGGVVPEAHGVTVNIDSDPAVVLHRDHCSVAVLVGITVTGELCLDEVRPVPRLVKSAVRVSLTVRDALRLLSTHGCLCTCPRMFRVGDVRATRAGDQRLSRRTP
jgi:hypothetical protein